MSLVKANAYQDASGGSNAVFSGVASPPNSMGFRNRIINGAMLFWQRGTSFSSPAFGAYTADRFYNPSGATTSIARSTDVPTGFMFSASITGNSGGSNGWAQRIESFNCSDLVGQSVTVSFWAKNSSGADNLQVVLFNATAQDNFGGLSSIGSTIVAASPSASWTYYTATFNSMPSGVANGMVVQVVRGQTAASTTLITGVQLEAGTVASPFERVEYGAMLRACQRYYYRQSASTAFAFFHSGFNNTTTRQFGIFNFPQMMRATPTLETTGTASNYQILYSGSNAACTGITLDGQTTNFSAFVIADVASGLTAGQGSILRANNTTSAYLGYSAEL